MLFDFNIILSLLIIFNVLSDYSGNLGSAALDPEPINRLHERSGDASDFERDKASPQQAYCKQTTLTIESYYLEFIVF